MTTSDPYKTMTPCADKCSWEVKCRAVCSNDTASMAGKHSGVVILNKELVLECKVAQCFLHQKFRLKKSKVILTKQCV